MIETHLDGIRHLYARDCGMLVSRKGWLESNGLVLQC